MEPTTHYGPNPLNLNIFLFKCLFQKACESLAWLRGMDRDEPELKVELEELPLKKKPVSAFRLINDLCTLHCDLAISNICHFSLDYKSNVTDRSDVTGSDMD